MKTDMTNDDMITMCDKIYKNNLYLINKLTTSK